MRRTEYQIAFQKAKEINKALEARGISEDSFVPLDDVLDCVKNATGYSDIRILKSSFSELFKEKRDINREMIEAGAMLSTETHRRADSEEVLKSAQLVVNSDISAEMQRFSIVHELGHLITEMPNFEYEVPDDGKFTLSTHINSDITYIEEKDCDKSQYLVAEQAANIFALLVLLRRNIKIRDLVSNERVHRLAEKYGVTEDALFSRMLLSNAADGGEEEKNGG